MVIAIFTEGTILMHKTGHDFENRANIVAQAKADIDSVHNYANYVPVLGVIDKIDFWANQGAEIYYITSRADYSEIQDILNVLNKFKFPQTHHLLFRTEGNSYTNLVEDLLPDVLIEDDCESMGENSEIIFPTISEPIKKRIKSWVVPEFGGITNLPNRILELALPVIINHD